MKLLLWVSAIVLLVILGAMADDLQQLRDRVTKLEQQVSEHK